MTLTLEEAHTRGFALVSDYTDRFLAGISAMDADALSTAVPGLDWTVGQVVAHLQSVYERYTTDLERSSTLRALAEQNAADVARLGLDVPGAVSSIRDQLTVLEAVLDHIEPGRLFPFHAGQRVTMAGGWGNLLGELLAHGEDIARATSFSFSVAPEDLEILWRYTAPALQGWFRYDATFLAESWRLRFCFGDIDVVLDRGSIRWGEETLDAPDHVLDIPDATEFALQVPYRRRPIMDPQIALLASRFHDL